MEEAFGTVVWVVAIVGAVVALFTLVATGRSYREIGGSGLVRDDSDARPESAATREEETRQMLEARDARRERRGEAPLDVEAEIEARDRPPPEAVDDALREEIREHVVGRNARRVRAGEDPLDVDEEIARRIRDLT